MYRSTGRSVGITEQDIQWSHFEQDQDIKTASNYVPQKQTIVQMMADRKRFDFCVVFTKSVFALKKFNNYFTI